MFIYPVDGKGVIEDLRRKIAEMEAELQGDIQRGRIINIDTQVKLEDARSLKNSSPRVQKVFSIRSLHHDS